MNSYEKTAETMLSAKLKSIKTDEVDLLACGTGVIFRLYDENPYTEIRKDESGLILGLDSSQKYKSHETGEVEENEELIVCGEVIATGESCKTVQVGDDVYTIKRASLPVPFRKKNYWTTPEHNILGVIRKRTKENE